MLTTAVPMLNEVILGLPLVFALWQLREVTKS